MKYRRIIITALAILMLAGCGMNAAPETTTSPSEPQEGLSPATETPTPEPTPSPRSDESLPDLVIVTASVSMRGYEGPGTCMLEYAPLEWTVCVANVGEADTDRFVVEAQVSEGLTQQWEVLGLAAGEETCLAADAPGGGDVMVDSEDAVPESDEMNNTEHIILPTLTPPPLCTPTPNPSDG
jgi:hypothetical protein